MPATSSKRPEPKQITAIREFNRFYTAELGLLRRRHLDGEFSLTEARILYELNRHEGTTATTLLTQLHLDKGYLSRLLSSLTKRRLLTQKESKADRRERILCLTDKGRREAKRLDELSERQIAEVLSHLSIAERNVVAQALTQVQSFLQQKRGRVVRAKSLTAEARSILNEYMDSVGVIQRDSPEAMRRLLKDPSAGMWLAYWKGELAGCVVLRRLQTMQNACEVKRLYVRPNARGQGLAVALLNALEEHAASSGFDTIYLDSKDDLIAAIALYRKRGYQDCEPYNDNPQATVFLRKSLSAEPSQRWSVATEDAQGSE